jgi:signal transduction histidine kinase
MFVNLMSNAFYALSKRRLEKSGEYCPAMVVTSRRMDGMAEVRLRDNGGGIPEHIRSRIFSPFFTTKPPGEGTGLGLSLSYDIIVNGHGGSIEVASRENEYTEFIIQVPLISGLQHPSGKLA